MQNMKPLIMANSLHGFAVEAEDGEIGHIDDFYLDERTWNIAHVAVDVSSWLKERKVLLSPEVFGSADWRKKHIEAKMTKKLVSESPEVDTLLPDAAEAETQVYRVRHSDLDHLWSVHSLKEYTLFSENLKNMGKIQDFLIDTETWTVRFLIIKTNDGREFLTQPNVVQSIDMHDRLIKIVHPEEATTDWQEYDPHYMALVEVAPR